MELIDTIPLMTSSDYKERFKAEYQQVKIRHDKLKGMLKKWDAEELDFIPTCPRNLYDYQIESMDKYLTVLKIRAKLEDIIF